MKIRSLFNKAYLSDGVLIHQEIVKRKTERRKRHTQRQKTHIFLDYEGYLQSPHWKKVKARFWKSKYKKKCCACGEISGLQLHHRTYKRIGNERLSDLVLLCRQCHQNVHYILKFGRKTTRTNLWSITQRYKKRLKKLQKRNRYRKSFTLNGIKVKRNGEIIIET